MDYIEKTDSRWVESYDNLSNSKEFGVDGSEHAGSLATAIGLYGSNRSLNGIDATIRLRNIVVENMLNESNKGNILFINSSGDILV